MHGATQIIPQPHQILRLPRRMTLMINAFHTCNAIDIARSNRCHCPTSPNTAPATKNDSHDQSSQYMSKRCHRPTSPNTVPATKSHPHHWSLSYMKRYVQCAEQQLSLTNLTKYCACHEKSPSSLTLVAYKALFTLCGALGVIVQPHQILLLPRKVTLTIDLCHIWNVIYNVQPHQILCLPRKMTIQNVKEFCWKQIKRHLQCAADPTMIRDRSDHDPSMNPSVRNPPRNRGNFSLSSRAFCSEKNSTFRATAIIPKFRQYCACHEKWHLNFTKYCACHEKWFSWLILFTHETLFTMRGATGVIVQLHQILRLAPKVIVMIDPLHTWNAIYNARSNMCHGHTGWKIHHDGRWFPIGKATNSWPYLAWKQWKDVGTFHRRNVPTSFSLLSPTLEQLQMLLRRPDFEKQLQVSLKSRFVGGPSVPFNKSNPCFGVTCQDPCPNKQAA